MHCSIEIVFLFLISFVLISLYLAFNRLEVITLYSNMASFFNPEILSFTKEEYDKLFDNKDLLEYKFMLDEVYKDKDHTLSEDKEIIINELESAMNNFEDISSNLLNNEHNYGEVEIMRIQNMEIVNGDGLYMT